MGSFWAAARRDAACKILLILSASICLGGFCLAASSPSQKPPEKPVSHARFAVHPSNVGLSTNQSQNFEVMDANGKAVAVRWKISGVGCSPNACGSIDKNGNYQAPPSLHQPVVVMLEGIPLSDAEFPAFARIQLSPGASAASHPTSNSPAASDPLQGLTITSLAPTSGSASAPNSGSITVTSTTATSTASTSATPTPAAPAPVQPSVKVSYRNGQLTIDATNETLADVLHAVARKIGATIDVPPGAGYERIVEHAGPAPASDVLTELLKGSHFNFVMIGSPQHPAELQQVLLTERNDSGVPVAVPTPAVVAASDPEPQPDTPMPTMPPGPASMTGAERLAYLRANGFGRIPTAQPDFPPDQPAQPDVGDMIKEKAREIRDNAQPDSQPAPAPGQSQPPPAQ
jgi:hypothetical protein